MAEPYSNYQYEIYVAGLGDEVPKFPIAFDALQAKAREVLDDEAFGYVAGAAGSEDTLRANLEAFRRWRIVPRMLRDVGTRDLSVKICNTSLPAPILLAPIGVQSIVHAEGELATARAASEVGIPFILSTASSHHLEEVADAGGQVPRWFQLYWPNDPELTRSFLKRAEAAGYEAIVVTLDTPLLAWRPRDLQLGFLPFLRGIGIANYVSDPVFRAGLDKPPEEDMQSAVMKWVSVFSNPSETWDDLASIRNHTDLPILLKGILDPDDARQAVESGMNGVIVSNHGGRQVDGGIATLDALPAVRAAVGDDVPILVDSGIRTGADALKALALGANAILLGRPYAWGLAVGGKDGVVQVIRSFLAELDLTLALTGCASVLDIDSSILERAS